MTLKMQNVCVKHGNSPVLNNLECELSPGQIVGLVGPNGTGKSTFINAVAGLVAYTGQISWQEKKVHMKTVGFMPQHCQVRADLTVIETVLLGMHERLGLRIALDFLDQAINILEEFGIAHLHKRSMQSLSGGQQQLVILAQRLIRRPDLLLLDEATSALDIHHQMRVFDQLQSYVEKTNALVIIAIHDLNLAARHTQTVLLLGKGSIVGQGKFNSVITERSLRDVYRIDSEIIQSASGRTAILPISAAR